MTLIYRLAKAFCEYFVSPRMGAVWAAMWGKISICVDVPHSAVIKHWNNPFKSAEETTSQSLVPGSIVRGALLDDVILPDCRVYFFTTLEDLSTLKGLREGGWRGWNHLDVQHCRFKAPSPRAQHTQHLFNILAASGLQPENCSSTMKHRASPLCLH